ncbi:DNA-methyltransferase [Desulfosporosinus nitroreducens]|uniref:DNA-methyltransferase n=1 Tax=Desulfosporosinus nitroreducens TaxID=2018668 RepID=UPI00207CA277|nr:site-specific DNA-methyltransferase [Desulfosporosinus nitroreducens]MCO1599863.1 site-specific DNA-methyltransferase [Desulfosporosinus nitroreducens]
MNTFYTGDVIKILELLSSESINCCVTSSPYYGLRDYGLPPTSWPEVEYIPMSGLPTIKVPAWIGCLGLEPSPELFIAHLVFVFREVRRALRSNGTLWLNLGDSYTGSCKGAWDNPSDKVKESYTPKSSDYKHLEKNPLGLKPKNLVGIPWRVAFALQADGWYLRSDIVWNKPNAMPSSVKDRPTRSHEYIFLLSKSSRYYYDTDAIKEPAKEWTGQAAVFERSGPVSNHIIPGQSVAQHRKSRSGNIERKLGSARGRPDSHIGGSIPWEGNTRNKRSVWTVATKPFKGAHFAVFPPDLVRPCILAGCPVGGTVMDPFGGSGTVAMVASELGMDSIYIDLNPEYTEIAKERCGLAF